MPFTLAHASAALPLRRLKLVWSALVIGTFAPDFWLFLGLPAAHHESHDLPHLLIFALPMALVVLWLFHRVLKRPLLELAPEGLRLRLAPYMGLFAFGGWRRFAAVVGSICLGMATHILWDSFTHPYTWFFEHWAWLRQPERLVLFGQPRVILHFEVLQLLSSVLGCAALALWFVAWYRSAAPASAAKRPVFEPGWRVAISVILLSVPWTAALWLATERGHDAEDFLHVHTFANYLVLLPAGLLAMELVVYALVTSRILKLRQAERA
jgi:hypothetical protein